MSDDDKTQPERETAKRPETDKAPKTEPTAGRDKNEGSPRIRQAHIDRMESK